MGNLQLQAFEPRSLAVLDIDAPDEPQFFKLNEDRVIASLFAVVNGVSSPTVDWTIRFASDRSAAGTELVADGFTTTSVSGETIAGGSLTFTEMSAGDYIWLEVASAGGDATRIEVQINWA